MNCNFISTSNIWWTVKHNACVLHCCLALLAVGAACNTFALAGLVHEADAAHQPLESGRSYEGSGGWVSSGPGSPPREGGHGIASAPQDPGQHTEVRLAAIWNVGRMLTEWNPLKGLVPLFCFPHMFLHPQTLYLGIQSISRQAQKVSSQAVQHFKGEKRFLIVYGR